MAKSATATYVDNVSAVDEPIADPFANQGESRSFLRTALAFKGSVSPRVMHRVIWAAIYSMFVGWLIRYYPELHLSILPFEYSGAVLGLVLVVRVNAGMNRWWEARKVWGSIVNQSRNLAIISTEYSDPDDPVVSKFLRWVAVWPYAMRDHLRDERVLQGVTKLIGSEEADRLRNYPHMPIRVGVKVAGLLKTMRVNGMDDFAFLRAETERASLINNIGACERIKTTPIPFVLAIKTRRLIVLFLMMLPLALVSKVSWLTPIIMCLTAYPLFCLDEIGLELQDPFARNNLSHLPLDKICKKIETDVLDVHRLP